jgi:hypothetical protein
VQQDGRRQRFDVAALFRMDRFRVTPDAHDVGKVVCSVFIIHGAIQKPRRKLVERVKHL